MTIVDPIAARVHRAMLVLAGAALVSALGPAPAAHACGGTFCDAGPSTSAVDQAAETVLFIQDGPYIEAHIQIAIDPDTEAGQFAWVVPMPAAPEFAVGSQPLFTALLAATSPVIDTWGGWCGESEDDGVFKFDAGVGPEPEPSVTTETVGAFEITTLEGGTVDAVMTWLGDNGYAQDEAARPILDRYLADGYVLVALELVPSADVAEIHPIVLRYLGDEPCLPIELTAVAAQDDMAIRAFFLGTQRWAPTNYSHVVVNPLRLPWTRGGGAYAAAITSAVDEAPAGHGFVTEYAGPASVVPSEGVYSARWRSAPFVAIHPTMVVDQLNAQGLAMCTEFGPCVVPHPLVVAMLRKYLPAPDGVNENDFYACVSCYADALDAQAWDGPAFAAELEQRVIVPGAHAAGLLERWSYLSRLFTTMSPHEMTVDPMFHPTAELPAVPLDPPATRLCVDCGSDAVLELPDGRRVHAPGGVMPEFDDGMPWAERIERVPLHGAPMVEVDNTAAVDGLLAAWNDQHACVPGAGGSSDGDGTTITTTIDLGDSDPGLDGRAEGMQRGCACATSPGTDPWWAWLAPALGVARRRRRRARPLDARGRPLAPATAARPTDVA